MMLLAFATTYEQFPLVNSGFSCTGMSGPTNACHSTYPPIPFHQHHHQQYS